MKIKVYRSSAIVERIVVLEGSMDIEKHQGENYLSILTYAVDKLDIAIGDYISYNSKYWYVNTLPKCVKMGSNHYEYCIVFESVLYDLGKVAMLDNGMSDFYLVGNAEFHLDLIISNLNRVYGSGIWSKGTVASTSDLNIQYQNENCLQALQKVCSELGVYFRLSGKQISISSTPGTTSGVSVEYGKNKGLYSITRNPVGSKNIITRLWVYGGMRNLASDYRNYSRRLMFADAGSNKLEKNVATYGLIEAVKIFDEIFPARTGTVSTAPSLTTFTDSGMDFDLNDYLMSGVTAKVHFNTGNLAGYEFEISGYNNTTKTFTIIPIQDMDMDLPNSTLKPAIGDKYKLVDILLPASYISAAETELQNKAQEYLDENADPNITYDLQFDPAFIRDNSITTLQAGDTVHVKDVDMNIDTNITIKSVSRNILNPNIIKVELNDRLEVQVINRLIANEVETQKLVRLNDLMNVSKARMNWKTWESLKNLIFDTDGYFDNTNIKPLSIESTMLSIGAKSQQFTLKDVEFTWVYYDASNHRLYWTSGQLIHFTIDDATIKTWDITGSNIILLDSTSYYIYARCNRATTSCDILSTTTQYKFDEGSTYYYFLIGVFHKKVDNARVFSATYGSTQIVGRIVKTGRISSNDGNTYVDLDTGDIKGKITFQSGTTDNELEEDVRISKAKWPADLQLKALWSLDETSGTVAYDDSNNGYDGSLTGGTRVEGVSGNALSLNGTSDYVLTDAVPNAILTTEFTLSAWVKIANDSPSYGPILYSRGTGTYIGLTVNSMRLLRCDASGTLATIMTTGNDIKDNIWHHVAGVYNGTVLKLYIDGVLISEATATIGNINSDANFYIGYDTYSGTRKLKGVVDEVRIYARALSEEEILGLYSYKSQIGAGGGRHAAQTAIDGGIITSGVIQLGNSVINSGISGDGSASSSIRIWAGNTYENRASAPFRVNQDGELIASKASIESSAVSNRQIIISGNEIKLRNTSTSEDEVVITLSSLFTSPGVQVIDASKSPYYSFLAGSGIKHGRTGFGGIFQWPITGFGYVTYYDSYAGQNIDRPYFKVLRNLCFDAGLVVKTLRTSSSLTLDRETHYAVFCINTSSITITLSSNPIDGQQYIVKRCSTGGVTISSSINIRRTSDVVTSFTVSNYESWVFVYDGTEYQVISKL